MKGEIDTAIVKSFDTQLLTMHVQSNLFVVDRFGVNIIISRPSLTFCGGTVWFSLN